VAPLPRQFGELLPPDGPEGVDGLAEQGAALPGLDVEGGVLRVPVARRDAHHESALRESIHGGGALRDVQGVS
jgi:hypothetical protein